MRIDISGEIGWGINSADITETLKNLSGEDIEVFINSPGGSVFDGLAIYNAFRDYKRKNPNAQILANISGLAASMASYLAVCPAFDLVTAEDNAVFMIHNVSGCQCGDYRAMNEAAKLFDNLTNIIAMAYSNKTGKPVEEYRKMMDDTTWLYGKEIFDFGLVDEIIISDADVNDKIKDTAIASAKLLIMETENKLKAHSEDLERIAACLDPQNPYPNEHAARIVQPGEFQQDTFRRKNIAKGIDIIIGKLKGQDVMTTQAYRFSIDFFTAAEAKKWLKDNKVEYISFEAAVNKPKSEVSAKAEIIPDIIPDENKLPEGKIMTLQELLKSNPDAQAEYDAALESARVEEREKVQKNAVEILMLEKATLSETAIDALNKNLSVEEYAVAVLKAEREKRGDEPKKSPFDVIKAAQIPADSAVQKSTAPSDEDLKNEAKKFFSQGVK